VQANNLVHKVQPAYPPLARQARIQGTVRFTATIGKDGHIIDLSLVSGHPLLVPAATEAVQQWIYRPTLLNGNPIEVVTVIDINFTLSDGPPLPAQ
jgi:protein TonB